MKTPRSKKEMITFLSSHFRYHTMNSWNCATSYAANVKLHRIAFPSMEIKERAYQLLGTEEAFDDVRFLMDEFARKHDYEWQAGFNGRSGGYIVLYPGGKRVSKYRSFCARCGQGNFTEATAEDNACGRCGTKARYNEDRFEVFTSPGKGVDSGEDFETWDTESLKARVRLVMEFDQLVQDCVNAFISFCANHKPCEEKYYVEKTRIAARPVENES